MFYPMCHLFSGSEVDPNTRPQGELEFSKIQLQLLCWRLMICSKDSGFFSLFQIFSQGVFVKHFFALKLSLVASNADNRCQKLAAKNISGFFILLFSLSFFHATTPATTTQATAEAEITGTTAAT